jgi:hypothetical protein
MRRFVLLLTALVSLASAATAETAITAKRWQTYTNTRYGVIVDYPADLFAIQPPPPDNAGRNFEARAVKARFFVYSHANALDQSRDELEAEDVADLRDRHAIRQSGTDWYHLVATKDGEVIVRRVLLSEGGTMVHRLEIAFPPNAADSFAPIVERMTKSFRVDPSIPEKASDNANGAPRSENTTKPEQLVAGDWHVKTPSPGRKDLPTLMTDREVTAGATLGNIVFVCDRSRYFVLLVSPFFEYRPAQAGRISFGGGAAHATSFRDLYGTRDPLGSKMNWDASILFSEIPKALLTQLTDGSTLRVDLGERSWAIEMKTIATQVQSFTSVCETSRRRSSDR